MTYWTKIGSCVLAMYGLQTQTLFSTQESKTLKLGQDGEVLLFYIHRKGNNHHTEFAYSFQDSLSSITHMCCLKSKGELKPWSKVLKHTFSCRWTSSKEATLNIQLIFHFIIKMKSTSLYIYNNIVWAFLWHLLLITVPYKHDNLFLQP